MHKRNYFFARGAAADTARHRLAAQVFEHLGEAVVVLNPAGRIILANPAFGQLLGVTPEATRGMPLEHYLAARSPEGGTVSRPDWGDADGWRGEAWLQAAGGRPIPVWLSLDGLPGVAGQARPLVASFTDISEPYRQRRALWELAHHDRVTGLPNLRGLMQRIDQSLAEAGSGYGHLLLVRVAGLTEIQGAHGHAMGERVARRLARRLAGLGEVLGYLEGGEFGLWLPDTTPAEAGRLARACLYALDRGVAVATQYFHLRPHAGLCCYPVGGQDARELIHHARLALREASRASTPGVRFFDMSQDLEMREQLRLEARLSDALARDAFRLVYQPQVDMASGHPVGAEALLRWHDAELGEVAPGRFIPVAEASGGMLEIGAWVLDEACRQLRDWRAAGHAPSRLAINISAPQLLDQDLPATVAAALERHVLPPASLELEVTEGLLLADGERAASTLRRLSEMGVGLALDDFGTGYASFAYLQRYHFHRLKIDRSLVRHVAHLPRDAAIVTAIVALGRALRMEVLAEGVEDAAQADVLRRGGCDLAQGYFYAHPLPPSEAALWRGHPNFSCNA